MKRITTRAELDRALAQIQASYSGTLAFAAHNLRTNEVVQINADATFPTASTIKLAILVELFRLVDAGRIDLHERMMLQSGDQVGGSGILKEFRSGLQPTIYDLAMLMVVLSDNTATNMLIDRVGGLDAINRTMQERYGLHTIVLHNRVDFAAIGGDIRRFGEASPADLVRLVAGIAQGALVSTAASAAMLDIMERQQYLDQLPRYFNVNPYAKDLGLTQEIRIGCKTGFFTGTRVDSGVIRLPEETTIAYCAMTDQGHDASFNAENEGAVINGLLGRVVLEYWWPASWDAARLTLPSPYIDALVAILGD